MYLKTIKTWLSGKTILTSMLCLLSAIFHHANAQSDEFRVNEWAEKLASTEDIKNLHFTDAKKKMEKMDSAKAYNILAELQKAGEKAGDHFQARFFCLKGIIIYTINHNILNKVRQKIKEDFGRAMRYAYESGDEYLIGFIGKNYGGYMYAMGDYELGTTYLLSSLEINERLFGRDDASVYIGLGELFFRIREYEK